MRRKADRMPTPVEMASFIEDYVNTTGWPPSRREAAKHFNISVERAQAILMGCRDDELIDVVDGGARQIKLTPLGRRRIDEMKDLQGRETQL